MHIRLFVIPDTNQAIATFISLSTRIRISLIYKNCLSVIIPQKTVLGIIPTVIDIQSHRYCSPTLFASFDSNHRAQICRSHQTIAICAVFNPIPDENAFV